MGHLCSAGRCVFIFSLLLIISPLKALAEEELRLRGEPVSIYSDRLEYDKKTDTYTAIGSVDIRQERLHLKADKVTLNKKTGDIVAEGRVFFEDGENTITMARMELNFSTKVGTIYRGKIFVKKDNYYIEGETIERIAEDRYRLDKGTLTACDEEVPDWRFRGSKVNIHINNYLTARNVLMEVKGVPVLYSPYILIPIKQARQTGFLVPRVGYNTNEGFKLNNAFFWAIADNKDATLYLDYYSEKGGGLGLEYRYILNRHTRGIINSYYLNEWAIDDEKERWIGKLNHEQRFKGDIQLRANLNYLSDRGILQDYSESTEERVQRYIDSNLFLTRYWKDSSLRILAQYTRSLSQDSDEVAQRLPAISYHIISRRIGESPVYFSLDTSATNFWREKGIKGQRLDLYPKLSTEIPLYTIGKLSPRIGIRETLYSRSVDKNDPTHREIYDLGIGFATRLYRVFSGRGRIERIRHSIEPEILYEYIPDMDQSDIPQFDGAVPSTLTLQGLFPLSSPQFAQQSAIDFIPKKNIISYSLSNRIVSRYRLGDKQVDKELFLLKLSQGYDINALERHLTNLRGELTINTLSLLGLYVDTGYNTYDGIFSFINSDLKLKGLYPWYLNIGQRYTKEPRIEFISGEGGITIKAIDASIKLWYDLFSETIREGNYTIKYSSQCWSITLSYIERPEEKQAAFLLELRGLGTVVKF